MTRPLSWPQIEWMCPSSRERMWSRIPLLGWFISGRLYVKRVSPVVQEIKTQLEARPIFPSTEWGSNPRRLEMARGIRRIIRDQMGWPNDHFIPDDPMDIVCWAHEDGLVLCHS